MAQYPINETAFLTAVEKVSGEALDSTNRALWQLIAELQNKAYTAGLRDGTIRQSAEIRANTPPPTEDADPKLVQFMQEMREMMEKAFEEQGFDSCVEALGDMPKGMPWGNRVYALMREAFFQGGVYAIVTCENEEENDHDRN